MNETLKALITLALQLSEAERKQFSAILTLSTLSLMAVEDTTDEALLRAKEKQEELDQLDEPWKIRPITTEIADIGPGEWD
jgi:hypothetical protein|tara:strand:- start:2813 stop:3055 length:243 start_codon:yes stop_codon:yes gene_type:complete